MAFPQLVSTPRLTLQRWGAAAHTEALVAINAQAAVVRFLNAGVVYTREESEAQSARFAEHWDTYGFGLWAIEVDARIVGFAGLCHPRWFPAYEHEVELAWRLHPSACGNGYATEAGRAALDAAATVPGLERVLAFIDPGNDASCAVAARLGLSLRELVTSPDGPIELWQ
jgi:RimJ/RimL family protein N-acetyltransferase